MLAEHATYGLEREQQRSALVHAARTPEADSGRPSTVTLADDVLCSGVQTSDAGHAVHRQVLSRSSTS